MTKPSSPVRDDTSDTSLYDFSPESLYRLKQKDLCDQVDGRVNSDQIFANAMKCRKKITGSGIKYNNYEQQQERQRSQNGNGETSSRPSSSSSATISSPTSNFTIESILAPRTTNNPVPSKLGIVDNACNGINLNNFIQETMAARTIPNSALAIASSTVPGAVSTTTSPMNALQCQFHFPYFNAEIFAAACPTMYSDGYVTSLFRGTQMSFPGLPGIYQSNHPFSIDAPKGPEVMIKRKRRHRTIFTQDQLKIMEAAFEITHYPDIYHRDRIAREVGLKEERIEVWFKNRRAKWRKKNAKKGEHHSESEKHTQLSQSCVPSIEYTNRKAVTYIDKEDNQETEGQSQLPSIGVPQLDMDYHNSEFMSVFKKEDHQKPERQTQLSQRCIPSTDSIPILVFNHQTPFKHMNSDSDVEVG